MNYLTIETAGKEVYRSGNIAVGARTVPELNTVLHFLDGSDMKKTHVLCWVRLRQGDTRQWRETPRAFRERAKRVIKVSIFK